MNRLLLITFIDVMETHNFKRTADRLEIMQSTVSARIRLLEDSLGVRLFERGRGGAEPTAAGRRFEAHCRALLVLWGQAQRDMQIGTTARQKRLHISCQYSLVRSYLVEWADRILADDVNLSLHVEINFSKQIQNDIISGDTDIGIMFAPQLTPDVQVSELGSVEFIMISTRVETFTDVNVNDYIKVAYTGSFQRIHDELMPELSLPKLVIGSDDLAIELLARQGGTLYLPSFAYVAAKAKVPDLKIVRNAPSIPQPVFSAFHIRRRTDPVIINALNILASLVRDY